ncbi:hypothetical protein ACFX1Q_008014 [Malus domestica]
MLRDTSGPWSINQTSKRYWVMSSRLFQFHQLHLQRSLPSLLRARSRRSPRKKPKKEPAKPKADAAEEVEEAPKPKPKNPLDLLPPSKMVFYDWKRLYSNTKSNFREVAIKGFWDMYDPEGYSLWFCEYKYNDENTVSFVTLNKVGGFLQQMDLARKYAFGKMLVIGSVTVQRVCNDYARQAVQWLCSMVVLSDGSGGASSSAPPPWSPPFDEIDKTKVYQYTPKDLLRLLTRSCQRLQRPPSND